MHGLKNVRNRRTDALTQVGWDQLEVMLAVYYRGQGYRVEHVGTGGSGTRFDGGIDLKLYKDDAYVVVQCKHWNAKQVTHNAVHELLGVMITQSATGAILVTSGEFSRAAIEAACKQGHVQLVDGDDLREMLGPLPVGAPAADAGHDGRASVAADAHRRGSHRGQPQHGVVGHAMDAGLGLVLLKLVVGLVIVLSLTGVLKSVLRPFQQMFAGGAVAMSPRDVMPVPPHEPRESALQTNQPPPHPVIEKMPADLTAPAPPTAAEIRESKRKAGEAMRILERSTPEM
jgi:restriction system protein